MSPAERQRLAEWCEEQARHRDVMMWQDRSTQVVGAARDANGKQKPIVRGKFMSWMREGDDFRALAKFLREAAQ